MHPKGQMAPHGTTSRYRRHRCRCVECREANRVAMAEWRASKRGDGETRPRTRAQHGTRSAYAWCTAGPEGGKCDDCRKANREYQRVYMQDHRRGITWDREDPAFAGW